MLISIPPNGGGGGRVSEREELGHKFWARGHFVSTVGRNEEMICACIRNREIADKELDQLQLKLASS
jgi:putative transposase